MPGSTAGITTTAPLIAAIASSNGHSLCEVGSAARLFLEETSHETCRYRLHHHVCCLVRDCRRREVDHLLLSPEPKVDLDVPKKLGGLPPIEFDYPSKVTLFSFRDDNLMLVAMDTAEKTRLRIVISAQLDKAKGNYAGQIVTDTGGNELMLVNGPVTCRVKG